MSYEILLHEDAEHSLLALDKALQERIIRMLTRMRNSPPGRHMKHGLAFFVEEAGQYRIVYTCEGDRKIVYFIGNHKDYEKWYLQS